jgi:hypothetical protein
MGKAKQRKKLKRNLQKRIEDSRFSIVESNGSWLILIDDSFRYCRMKLLDDAKRAVEQLIDYEINNPLPPLSQDILKRQYLQWIFDSSRFIDHKSSVNFLIRFYEEFMVDEDSNQTNETITN